MSSGNITDTLHAVFTTLPTNTNGSNVTTTNLDKERRNPFVPSNENNTNHIMSNDKIMALFHTPQTSTATAPKMNIHPAAMPQPNST